MSTAPARGSALIDERIVDDLAREAGIGTLDWSTLRDLGGRNATSSVDTVDGRRLVVKRLIGERRDAGMRLRRLISAAGLETHGSARIAPRVLAHHGESRTVVFEHVGSGAVDLTTGSAAFTVEVASALGRTLAALHLSRPGTGEGLPAWDEGRPELPSSALWRAVPFEAFVHLTYAERQAWGLLHGDQRLLPAIRSLEDSWSAASAPIHGDLRLDQVLPVDGGVEIVDWEEARIGDPARDLGFVVGDLLRRCVLDAVEDRRADQGSATTDEEPPLGDAIGSRVLQALPALRAFVAAYGRGGMEASPRLIERSFRYAGWRLAESMLVDASRQPRLGARSRAVAGLGFDLMAQPERFAAELRLTDAASSSAGALA